MTSRRALVPLLVGLLVGGTALAGDREDAEKEGRTLLRSRKWEGAEAAFRRALAEDPGHLASRIGLVEALLGAGRRPEALALLRETVGRSRDASDEAASERKRLESLWRKCDPLGLQLERAIERHAAQALDLAEDAVEADPELAAALVRRVEALAPAHPGLRAAQVRFDLLSRGDPLFDGESGRGWAWFDSPGWHVVNGAVHGRGTDVYAVTRTELRLQGDFDVRAEARVVEGGGAAVFLLQAGWSHFQRNVSLGMRGKGVLFLEGHELGSDADPPSAPAVKTRKPVDPSAWNLFELQFRADRVRAFVGGEEVGSVPRSAAYREGHVALQVLASTVAFRRLEVVRR